MSQNIPMETLTNEVDFSPTTDRMTIETMDNGVVPRKSNKIALVWRELDVYATNRHNKSFKRIINNVNGAIKTGSLVAMMGPSGAGKSTLMSALAYRSPVGTSMSGDILVQGRTIGPFMHQLSGYMHQEDLLIGYLTISEHLHFMARFKMDRRLSYTHRCKRVEELLQQVGLHSVRDTRIGDIGEDKLLSGGEKKRLSFATEMLMNPSMLFCDEPTTGLDSFSAQKLVKILKNMTADNRTVICTIHQPSSEVYGLFDYLILLADGRIAFSGTKENAFEFFKMNGYNCPRNYNPADFFIETLAPTPGSENASRIAVRRLCDEFSVSDASKELDVDIQLEFHMMSQTNNHITLNKFRPAFWWIKLIVLTYRYVLQVIRDPSVQGVRILQKIAIAIMAGLCFVGVDLFTQYGIQSVQGALFILISENTFPSMYSTLAMFPQEFPLFLREYRSGLYSIEIYYIAKILSTLPGLIIEPIIFVFIVYWLAGLKATLYAFSMTLLITALVMNISTACGCMFSCAFDSVPLAMAYLIPFDYALMITSGLFVKLSSLPDYISWTQYISWLKYSNEAMTIVQWEDITNITCTDNPQIPCLKDGNEVLNNYSFSEDHLWSNIIAMFVLYAVFHVIGLIFLRYRAKRN